MRVFKGIGWNGRHTFREMHFGEMLFLYRGRVSRPVLFSFMFVGRERGKVFQMMVVGWGGYGTGNPSPTEGLNVPFRSHDVSGGWEAWSGFAVFVTGSGVNGRFGDGRVCGISADKERRCWLIIGGGWIIIRCRGRVSRPVQRVHLRKGAIFRPVALFPALFFSPEIGHFPD